MTAQRFIAYKITNTVNGKVYIGVTTTPLALRWRKHRNAARAGARAPLYSAIRKYGAESFVIEVAVSCATMEELLRTERRLIEECGAYGPRGYNATLGGDGAWGNRHSAIARANMRAAWDRRWPTRAALARAWSEDFNPRAHQVRPVVVAGIRYPSLNACARAFGMCSGTAIRYWIRTGRARYAPD